MDNKKMLGKRIKAVRKLKGLTQEKLAEIIGLETGSLSAIESGRHFPSIITLEKIAECFDVQLQTFFDFTSKLSDDELKSKIVKNVEYMNHKQLYCFYVATEVHKSY